MTPRVSPFKLTTRFRGWSRALAAALAVSVALNFALTFANARLSANLSTPRIVVKAPNGIVLPVAASAFVWTPEVTRDYVRLFLPILYSWTPLGTPSPEVWSPFISPSLLKAAEDRFRKNQSRIEAEGLSQTLLVREVAWDPESESARVIAELRQLRRDGQIIRTPLNLTVELPAIADPLNPYGHAITNVR